MQLLLKSLPHAVRLAEKNAFCSYGGQFDCFLAHMDYAHAGSFSLVEVDLSHLISPELLLPIKKREESRLKRAKQKKQEDRHQKRLARRAVEASRAPTIEEFKSMPDLTTFVSLSTDESGSFSSVPQCAHDDDQESKGGISWSSVTKLGFAASG